MHTWLHVLIYEDQIINNAKNRFKTCHYGHINVCVLSTLTQYLKESNKKCKFVVISIDFVHKILVKVMQRKKKNDVFQKEGQKQMNS